MATFRTLMISYRFGCRRVGRYTSRYTRCKILPDLESSNSTDAWHPVLACLAPPFAICSTADPSCSRVSCSQHHWTALLMIKRLMSSFLSKAVGHRVSRLRAQTLSHTGLRTRIQVRHPRQFGSAVRLAITTAGHVMSEWMQHTCLRPFGSCSH